MVTKINAQKIDNIWNNLEKETEIMNKMPAIKIIILTFTLLSISAISSIAEMAGNDVESTRATLDKWVETRRIISKEKQDFVLSKEILNERIELVTREIDSLKKKIIETETSITEADEKRATLMDENDKFKEASGSLGVLVMSLEYMMKDLIVRLPDPLKEKIKPLTQRLPQDPKDTKMSLGERFQNIVGILNEVDKFNREITATSEVRDLPDGTSSEVTALYVGISQGYYANAKGTIAGVGTFSPKGWMWTPANEAAADISQAISILKNEAIATFVKLPIEIK